MISAIEWLLHSSPAIEQQRPQDRVAEIAHRSLRELAVGVGLAGICSCFVKKWSDVLTIAKGLSIQTIVNLALRILLPHVTSNAKIIEGLTALSFAWYSVSNVQCIAHEAGHALAARLLLDNPTITIGLTPFRSAFTHYKGIPTLGRDRLTLLIAGAGPLFTFASSIILLMLGLTGSRYELIASALLDFGFQTQYAYSALHASQLSHHHDFVALWQLGHIHPAVPMAIFSLVPISVLSYSFFRNSSSSQMAMPRL